jgi:hypothetical protein
MSLGVVLAVGELRLEGGNQAGLLFELCQRALARSEGDVSLHDREVTGAGERVKADDGVGNIDARGVAVEAKQSPVGAGEREQVVLG